MRCTGCDFEESKILNLWTSAVLDWASVYLLCEMNSHYQKCHIDAVARCYIGTRRISG